MGNGSSSVHMCAVSDRANNLQRWLSERERLVLPRWMAELMRKGGLESLGRTTRDLRHHVFLIYYDRLCQAVVTGETDEMDGMLRNLVRERVGQNYDIRQILQFPLELKSTLWRLISQEFAPADAQEVLDLLDPILDHSTGVLVEAYAQVTEAALNERVDELEFLTQRLAQAGEERERAFRQLHSLYTISRTVSSTLDIREMLGAIASNLVAHPAVDRCSIWLVTSEDTLRVGVCKGQGESDMADVTLPLSTSSSFLTRALRTRKRQRLSSQGDALASIFDGHTAMAIPMLSETRPLGVVVIEAEPQAVSFDSSIASFVQAATEQAAVALENAQLYTRITRFNQDLEEKVRQRTSELEEINKEQERTNRDLERLGRTMSDFINIAAHELKTPLTLIHGYSNILQDDSTIRGNPMLVKILGGIIKGGERLYDIIEKMIDVSMIDGQILHLCPAPTSVGNLVHTLADKNAQALQERRLALLLGDFRELPYIEADSQRLFQVFDNLLLNAIKYTPDGGSIEIDAWTLEGEAEEEWVEVVFADSGIGIDIEHQERIFEKFYQTGRVALHSSGKTKFKGGGPGLGLAIAKGIVDAHGGKIWVKSERHDEQTCPGSQFHVVLPVKSPIRTVEVRSPFSYAPTSD